MNPIQTASISIIILTALAAASCSRTPPRVVLSLDLLQAEISQGEPVLARLSFWNDTRNAVQVEAGPDFEEKLLLTAAGPHWKTEGLLVPPRPMIPEGYHRGIVTLKPGERRSWIHLLNRWKKDWLPGDYQVSLQLLVPPRIVAGSTVPSMVSWAALRVVPTDRVRRERRLHQRMLQALTAKERQGPTPYILAICHFEDPITTPFLRELLETSAIGRYCAIPALGRIGTVDAAEALLALLSQLPGTHHERPEVVRALESIGRRTENQTMKERIQAALP